MTAITDLATASSVANANYYVISQSGTDKKVTHSTVLASFITAGTWSPTLAFSGGNGTGSAVFVANYMTIGDGTNKLIYIYMEAVITKGSASGNVQFTGMPVNASAVTVFPLMTVYADVGHGSHAYCNTTGAIAIVKSDSASGGSVLLTATDLGTTSYIRISGMYRYT